MPSNDRNFLTHFQSHPLPRSKRLLDLNYINKMFNFSREMQTNFEKYECTFVDSICSSYVAVDSTLKTCKNLVLIHCLPRYEIPRF